MPLICVAKAGTRQRIVSNCGMGFPRTMLDTVHMQLRTVDMRVCGVNDAHKCAMAGAAPAVSTWSRIAVESPAIFPNAQLACSRMSSADEYSKRTKFCTAPG